MTFEKFVNFEWFSETKKKKKYMYKQKINQRLISVETG